MAHGNTQNNSSGQTGTNNQNNAYTMYNPYASMLETSNTLRPEFDSMADNFTQSEGKYSNGLNALRDTALRKGPSQWLSMSLFQNALKQSDAKEKGMLENAGATAKARDALAAGGGLSGGARERVEEQGQKNYMSMAQDNSRQGTMADLGMRVQDESNRGAAVGALTNAEEAKQKDWLTAKQTDYQNQLDIYKTQMESIAAERQAQATENSGKK